MHLNLAEVFQLLNPVDLVFKYADEVKRKYVPTYITANANLMKRSLSKLRPNSLVKQSLCVVFSRIDYLKISYVFCIQEKRCDFNNNSTCIRSFPYIIVIQFSGETREIWGLEVL